MKVVALISGGKDSLYTLCKIKDIGHEIPVCIYMHNKEEYVDSWMYQTVGSEMIKHIEKALQIPFIIKETKCKVKNNELEYKQTEDDEVEDLYEAIKEAKEKYNVEGVCSGAIRSTYQKGRVENICSRLNLTSFTPLWGRDSRELLKEMIDYKLHAVIVKVASSCLKTEHLCKDISEIYKFLEDKKGKTWMDYCGEGGEYESICVDCKYYKNKIDIESHEICIHPEDVNKTYPVVYCKIAVNTEK